MTVGPVYEDPRGKIHRDGQREHVFTVRAGDFVRVHRFPTRGDAERAHHALTTTTR